MRQAAGAPVEGVELDADPLPEDLVDASPGGNVKDQCTPLLQQWHIQWHATLLPEGQCPVCKSWNGAPAQQSIPNVKGGFSGVKGGDMFASDMLGNFMLARCRVVIWPSVALLSQPYVSSFRPPAPALL